MIIIQDGQGNKFMIASGATIMLEKGDHFNIVLPGEELNVELTQDTASVCCQDGFIAFNSEYDYTAGSASKAWQRTTPPKE
jgi:hypothetical protein